MNNFKTTKLDPFGLLVEPLHENASIRDLDISQLKDILSKEHLVALRGWVNFNSGEEFSAYCEQFSEISLWPFGKVLELVEQDNPEDHVFDNSYMPFHWDGMFRKQVPETQVFHCVSAPGISNGGGTTFVNTKLILEKVSDDILDLWSKVTITYTRKMEFYDSQTIAPIITNHPEKGYPVIRYCEPPVSDDESFINHHGFDVEGISKQEVDSFVQGLKEVLYSPEFLYTHQWRTDDVVFSDNHTMLHGREPFTKGAPRHLRRVQLLGETPLDNPHLVYTK